MSLNDQEKRRLYRGLIDVACGPYEPGDLTSAQQNEAIFILRCRLAQYKQSAKTREEFGPLQPALVLSQISKVPVEVVRAIAEEFELELPDEIVLEQEDEQEEDIEFDVVFEPDMESFDTDSYEEEPEDFFGGEGANGAVDYVEKVLAMMKSGQIHAISVAAVNNDGKASLWVPDNIEEDRIQELFSPIIDALNVGPYKKPN